VSRCHSCSKRSTTNSSRTRYVFLVMAWYDSDSWLSRAWGPYLSTIIITLIITLTLPIFIHYFLYKSRTLTTTPTFLVVGPSRSGKTAFVTKVCTVSIKYVSNLRLLMINPARARHRSTNTHLSISTHSKSQPPNLGSPRQCQIPQLQRLRNPNPQVHLSPRYAWPR
jgi:hypothetical protein